ncbi:MAG: hypothetical protein AB1374_06015 [Bacillota bacterium]
MKYECVTHGIKVKVTLVMQDYDVWNPEAEKWEQVSKLAEKRRHYESPPGSWAGVPQCKLLTMKEFSEGRFGPCEIRRVG